MNEENYFFVNGQRGFDPSQGGHWSKWPIPAARVLMHNKEWEALRVLSCLITHLGFGKSADRAWPTIKTMVSETGMGKANIQVGIKTLILYGFIVKHKVRQGRYLRNEYQVLTACYKFQDMNEYAQLHAPSRSVKVSPNTRVNNHEITPAINPPIPLMEIQAIDYNSEDPFNIW